MQNNEALIFKGWDSDTSNKVVKFTPHTLLIFLIKKLMNTLGKA